MIALTQRKTMIGPTEPPLPITTYERLHVLLARLAVRCKFGKCCSSTLEQCKLQAETNSMFSIKTSMYLS